MIPSFSALRRLVLTVSCCSFAAACGTPSYDTVKIKQYKLSLAQGDSSLVPELKQLVTDYNTQAGVHVLDYVDNAADANSAIIITAGLQSATDGKVGLGQWMSETEVDSPISAIGGKGKRTITYSMRIEFDQNYMKTKTHYDNQKLFFHEVGHGLEMDHIQNDQTEVMYPDVDGDKNFPRYFQRVQAYMSDT